VSTNPSGGRFRRPYHVLCGTLLAVSVAGMFVSLTLHIGALAGVDWRPQQEGTFWFSQGMLLMVYLPICAEIIRRKDYRGILEPNRWQRRALWSATAYYAVCFYLFLYRAADELKASHTWEMISAGMLLAFSVAAVHYLTRFSRSRAAIGEKRSAATLPSP
jgi:hypothetical protein